VNWQILLMGFILFRVFDIWSLSGAKPGTASARLGRDGRRLVAGVYAAILLRLALHFNLV